MVNNPQTTPKKPWFLAIGVAGIGLVLLQQAMTLPLTHSYAKIGPGLMVLLVGAGLLVCGLILAWQIHHGEKFEPQETEDVDLSHEPDKQAFLWVSAGCLSAVTSIQFIGFPLAICAVFILVARGFMEHNYVKSAIIGLVFASIIWFGFKSLGLQLGAFLPFYK